MTVRDLIKRLEQYDDNEHVVLDSVAHAILAVLHDVDGVVTDCIIMDAHEGW